MHGVEGNLIAALTEIAEATDVLAAEQARQRAARMIEPEAIAMRRLVDALVASSHERHELARLATEDALTGLANRRAFGRALSRELARRARSLGPAVVLLDLDGLKGINDRFGHAAGDEAIVACARACEGSVRAGDLAARLGGDELALLLPDADLDGAMTVALRVRERVRACAVRGERLEVSFGIAVAGPDGDDADALLHLADERMYDDKRGRRLEVSAA